MLCHLGALRQYAWALPRRLTKEERDAAKVKLRFSALKCIVHRRYQRAVRHIHEARQRCKDEGVVYDGLTFGQLLRAKRAWMRAAP